MRILLIHSPFAESLRAMGHEVLVLWPEAGLADLPVLVAESGFTPDLILQREHMGNRAFLRGLEQFDCPKLFWSIDTHLNAFWQRWYGRLFDLVLTTQPAWVAPLKGMGLPGVALLPWFGRKRPFTPFAKRPRPLAFAGRITDARPRRARLLEFLGKRFPTDHRDDLDFDAMMNFYGEARLVPNESICGEINFRLFEAASCGCLVLTEDVGPELADLFAPDREIIVYGDALELEEHIRRYLADRNAAEAVGLAAWKRVRERHLEDRRAADMLALAKDAAQTAAGPDADVFLGLALLELGRARRPPAPLAETGKLASSAPWPPEAAPLAIRMLSETRQTTALAARLAEIEASPRQIPAADPVLASAASLAALAAGNMDQAKRFVFHRLTAARPRRRKPPENEKDHLVFWARELAAAGHFTTPGFAFNPDKHLPQTAVDCLLTASARDPDDPDVIRLLQEYLGKIAGAQSTRLGLLSRLTLHDRADWRLGLELGLVNLECFRRDQGIEELHLARLRAREAGLETHFLRVLSGRDPSGRIRRALEAAFPRRP